MKLEETITGLQEQLSQSPSQDSLDQLAQQHQTELKAKIAEAETREKEHWQSVLDKRIEELKQEQAGLEERLAQCPAPDSLEQLVKDHEDEMKVNG